MPELEVFDYCLIYPMDFEFVKDVVVRKAKDGSRQTRTKRNSYRKLDVKGSYYEPNVRSEVIDFWHRHHPDVNFLMEDSESGERFEAWISSTLKAPKRQFVGGDFAFTIEEVGVMPLPTPIDNIKPTIPGNVAVNHISGTLVRVTWNASSDAVGVTGYYVRLTGPGYNGVVYDPGNVLSFDFAGGLSSDTNYTLEVAARDAAGNISNYSAPVPFSYTSSGGVGTASNIKINCAGEADGNFIADQYYAGGVPVVFGGTPNTAGLTDPAPSTVYPKARYAAPGAVTYTIPVEPGFTYKIRLHQFYDGNGANVWVNDINVNGVLKIDNKDTNATGSVGDCFIDEIPNISPNGSGNIVIEFTSDTTGNTKISAIEIIEN